ncbi:MAG: hypothetical protein EU548_08650, partial [Promethearchaeota archaeon]
MVEIIDSIFLQVEKFQSEPQDPFLIALNSVDSKQIDTEIDDIVHLKGKKSTAGICSLITYEKDDEGIIKLTGILCQNAGVEPGDFVEIKKVEKPEKAKEVILRPYNLNLGANEKFNKVIRKELKKKPIMLNDIIKISKRTSREIFFVVEKL